MKLLKYLVPGEIFWTYTDNNVIQYQFIGKMLDRGIWYHSFFLAKEIVTGKELYLSEIIHTFMTEEEAIEALLNELIDKKETYTKEKELIEKDITKCNSLICNFINKLPISSAAKILSNSFVTPIKPVNK